MNTRSQSKTLVATPPAGGTPESGDQTVTVPRSRSGRGWLPRISNSAVMIATIVLLTLLVFVPVSFVFFGAIAEEMHSPFSGFQFDDLREAYASWRTLALLFQTLAMSLGVALLSTVLGAAFAWALTRVVLPLQRVLEMFVLAPLFLSPFVGAIAWMALGAPESGMLNVLARSLGLPDWISINTLSVGGVVFVLAVYYVPYGYLFLAGSVRNMDSSLEEASYVSGRGTIRTALSVTFPLVRGSMLSSLLFIAILATGMFSVPAILGVRSNFRPLAVETFRAVQGYPANYQRAAAIGTMIVLVSMVGIYFYRRSVARSERFVTVSGKGRPSSPIQIGWLRFVVAAGILLYALVTVILPYAALVISATTPFAMRDVTQLQFTLDPLRDVLASAGVREAFLNTTIVAIVVPIGCVLVALLTVYVTERLKLRGSAIVANLAIAPLAVPGIVFGIGVVWLYIRTPLYATLAVIMLAYLANYLPQAIRITGNGLTQIDRSLEEASTVCGASRVRTVGRIVAPLLKPSVFSAMVLVMILTIREINTAIVLYSPSSTLVSVLAFNYTDSGSLSSAAVVGLLQTLMMIVAITAARVFLGVRTSRSQL